MDTAKLLAELERSEAICAAATDGPWFSYSTVNGPTVQVAAGFIMIAPWHFRGGSYEKVNNCAFAAHARTELPARNQQLREALAKAAAELEGPE